MKCIPLKLLTLESFLDENPYWRGKIVFVLVGISNQERGNDYLDTQHDVITLVSSINKKYPGFIIFEEHKESDMKLAQRVPLLTVTDILLISCARPLLDTLPMEYCVARSRSSLYFPKNNRPFDGGCNPNQGIVILSEFDSCVRVMRGCLLVNPWQSDKV
jgi:trehalose-6-phosphate synthase